MPNIRYVIDLGFARISPAITVDHASERQPIEAISQAAANQRKGGAVALSGVCILVDALKNIYDSRPEFTGTWKSLRINLASVILQMERLQLGDVNDFDFITPPDLRLVNDRRPLIEFRAL